jgi:hypothetical protein
VDIEQKYNQKCKRCGTPPVAEQLVAGTTFHSHCKVIAILSWWSSPLPAWLTASTSLHWLHTINQIKAEMEVRLIVVHHNSAYDE